MTRFATALGHDGYPALRQRIRDLLRPDAAVPAETPDEARRNEWQRAVAAERDNLASLSEFLADPIDGIFKDGIESIKDKLGDKVVDKKKKKKDDD